MSTVMAAMIALVVAVPVLAAPTCMLPTGEYVPSQAPYTYFLDRRNPYDAAYADRYGGHLPALLETGMLTPGHPYFGPVCDLTAIRAGRPEPTVEEFIARYRENRTRAPEVIRQLHEAGAERVITYICMMTTGGDPEKRLGFWRFYDNWDAFAEFDIPDKPADDPEQWQQRKPDGTPFIAYTRAHPPYQPMFRWTNCVNNPGWRAYQRWVTEEAARVGCDGFFVDNAGTQRCYCSHCQALFAEWLRERYTAAEIAELFGGDLSMAPGGKVEAGSLRQAEVELFWQESIHRFLSDIKAWGAAIRGEFFVFPNGLHGRAHFVGTRFRDCDLAMDENSSGDLSGNPGVGNLHVIAGLHVRRYNYNTLLYKYVAGTGARCRGNVLAYCGYPQQDLPNLGPNFNTAVLGHAEAAAFGGGGCYAPTAFTEGAAQAIAVMNEFFRKNEALYVGKYPFGQVAVLGFALPSYFGDRQAYANTASVLGVLMDAGLLADIVPERVFSLQWLSRWPMVVVPGVRYLADAQLQTLLAYTQAGGKLILAGSDNGVYDQLGRSRPAEALQALRAAAAADVGQELDALVQPGGLLDGQGICQTTPNMRVRFAAWVDHPERPAEIILHAVNYDVHLGTAHDRVGEISDLALRVPLPAGARAARATVYAPGEAPQELAVSNDQGRAVLTLPHLKVYAVVRIDLQRGEG